MCACLQSLLTAGHFWQASHDYLGTDRPIPSARIAHLIPPASRPGTPYLIPRRKGAKCRQKCFFWYRSEVKAVARRRLQPGSVWQICRLQDCASSRAEGLRSSSKAAGVSGIGAHFRLCEADDAPDSREGSKRRTRFDLCDAFSIDKN